MASSNHSSQPVPSGADTLFRPRYFPRQVVTAADLNADQTAILERQRRRHRLLTGFGVVCGLDVTVEASTEAGVPPRVRVATGFAVSPNGDEIFLAEPRIIDIDCCLGDPCPPTEEPAVEEVIYVVIRYAEVETAKEPSLPDRCAGTPVCEHSRIKESADVYCKTEIPPIYIHPYDCDDYLDRIRTGDLPACTSNRGDEVLLARVTIDRVLAANGIPEFTPHIDVNDRRVLFSADATQDAVRCLETRLGDTGYTPGELDPDIGVNGMIQSSLRRANVDRQLGDREIVVREGSVLTHYWLDSSNVALPWARGQQVSASATGPAALIQSTYGEANMPGNFELVVLEGEKLVHYWFNNSVPTIEATWSASPRVIPALPTGPASLIQSDLRRRPDTTILGDFEIIVPESGKLRHYWWNGSDPPGTGPEPNDWQPLGTLPAAASGPCCFIQSVVKRADDGAIAFADIGGDFEVVVLEGRDLVHYWRNSTNVDGMPDDSASWRRGRIITANATGPGCLFQSTLRRDGSGIVINTNIDQGGDFEVVVPEGNRLVHYGTNPFDASSLQWFRAHAWEVTPEATGPATVIDSTFTDEVPGGPRVSNFQLAVPERNHLSLYMRQNINASFPWQHSRSWEVTRFVGISETPPNPPVLLQIESFDPVQDEEVPWVGDPVTVTVRFNKPVDPSSIAHSGNGLPANFIISVLDVGIFEPTGTFAFSDDNREMSFSFDVEVTESSLAIEVTVGGDQPRPIVAADGSSLDINGDGISEPGETLTWTFDLIAENLRLPTDTNVMLVHPSEIEEPLPPDPSPLDTIDQQREDEADIVEVPQPDLLPEVIPVSLDHLPGMTGALVGKLRSFGIIETSSLAAMETAALARMLGVSHGKASGIIWAARQANQTGGA